LIVEKSLRDALAKILAYERERLKEFETNPVYKGLPPESRIPAWELMDIPVEWHIVRKLILAGLVKRVARKWYVLTGHKKVEELLAEDKEVKEEVITEKTSGLPPDLFDVIEGYEDLKDFIKLSLTAEEPVHVLLVGAPGTAKSLFLMEIERLEGSRFITAGTATKVGIRDVIFEELPRYLIIDEIDKISDAKDLSALLTWMESGRVIIIKHGIRDERRGKGWVFAACNRLKGLPPELIDRFQVFHIKPYTPEQYHRVVTGYLTKRMGIEPELASYVAEKVGEYTVSVREAVRIARLCKTKEDVDRVISIVKKYSRQKLSG